MTSELLAVLSMVAADPARVADVRPEDLPVLIGETEALRARLWAALHAPKLTAPPGPSAANGADKLLSVDQAAERLGVSRRWIYRHQEQLPVRRLPGGALRFSDRALTRWQESRRSPETLP